MYARLDGKNSMNRRIKKWGIMHPWICCTIAAGTTISRDRFGRGRRKQLHPPDAHSYIMNIMFKCSFVNSLVIIDNPTI